MGLKEDIQAQVDELADQIGTSGKGTVTLPDGSTLTVDYTAPPPPPPKDSYDREELIEVCERAFVREAEWSDRDSARAQMQLGQAYALLKAGCNYFITKIERGTIWVTITYKGFNWFEGSLDGPDHRDELKDDESFYLPTVERLDRANGGDWY